MALKETTTMEQKIKFHALLFGYTNPNNLTYKV